MKTISRTMHIAALAVMALLSGQAFAEHDKGRGRGHQDRADENGRPHEGRLGHCLNGEGGRLCTKCLEFLRPQIEGNENIPAFRDGRLSFDDLLVAAQRDRFTEPPAALPEGDPNEAAATDDLYLSRDPGTPPDPDGPLLPPDPGLLDRLQRGVPFQDIAIHFDRRLGPSYLENLSFPPPEPPGPYPPAPQGFPDFLPPPESECDLNIGGFLTDMHAALAPNVNGYALRIRKNGATVGVLQWNWARDPNDGDLPGLGWNSNRRMHVASVSKFMTAIGLVHLLENSGNPSADDEDDVMWAWLPAYWNRTAGSNEFITFDHLMDHRSGYSTGGSSGTWATMKSNVNAGSPGVGGFDYENMNFGLIRILISTVGGYIHPNTYFAVPGPAALQEAVNDAIWDAITQNAYDDYMQTYVFNPVGAHPVLDTNSQTALAYEWDGDGPGWNSGDLAGGCGGYAWHMTINEVLNVTRGLYKGAIVSFPKHVELRDRSWGLNSPRGASVGDPGGESFSVDGEPCPRLFYKAGKWTTSVGVVATARTEQCFVLFQPLKDIEVVVFVNSNVTAADVSLTTTVRTAFLNNVEL